MSERLRLTKGRSAACYVAAIEVPAVAELSRNGLALKLKSTSFTDELYRRTPRRGGSRRVTPNKGFSTGDSPDFLILSLACADPGWIHRGSILSDLPERPPWDPGRVLLEVHA